MDVYTTLYRAIRLYPMCDSTREHVLTHLFCTVGNGYNWCLGELVSITGEEPDFDVSSDDALEQYHRNDVESQRRMIAGVGGMSSPAYAARVERRVAAYMAIAREAEQRALPGHPDSRSRSADAIYPVGDYSSLANVPDDVTPGWLQAAAETINYVRRSGRGMRHPETVDVVELIRLDLCRRFPEALGEYAWSEVSPGYGAPVDENHTSLQRMREHLERRYPTED